MNAGELRWIQGLEPRTLLAHIAPDLDFGTLGEAKAGGSLLVAPVSGGKILAVGSTRATRLTSSGTVDPTFKDSGDIAAPKGFDRDATDAVLGEGRVYIGGAIEVTKQVGNFISDTIFVRAINRSNGHAATGFGDGGVVTLKSKNVIPGQTLTSINQPRIAATPDGGVIIGITQSTTKPGFNDYAIVLYKLDSMGKLDTAFGKHGVVVGISEGISLSDLEIDAAGRVVLQISDDGGEMLRRLKANGSTDKTFGENGVFQLKEIRKVVGLGFPFFNNFTFDSQGRFLLNISDDEDLGQAGEMVRLNTDLTVDMGFGISGVTRFSFVFMGGASIRDIALDSDERILLVYNSEIIRLTADGKFDNTFDDNGIAGTPREVQEVRLAVDDSDRPVLGAPRRITRFTAREQVVLLGDGTLRVDGSEDDDVVSVSLAKGKLKLAFNDQAFNYSPASVSELSIFAQSGGNTVTSAVDLPTTVVTGEGFDVIQGSDTSISIDSGGGRDKITTGAGDDEISFSGAATIKSHGGDDVIVGGTQTGSTFEGQVKDVIDSGEGDDRITLAVYRFVTTTVELDGGPGNDVIDTGDAQGTMHGGDGNDVIIDGDNPTGITTEGVKLDTIFGDGGNDTLRGGFSNDYLSGGGGRDKIFGEGGQDEIAGGDGNDFVDGGTEKDTLSGQTGDDTITGGDGADIITGGDDNDSLLGDGGIDTVFGTAGKDTIDGGESNDIIDGQGGDDDLSGAGGNDQLTGGAGADVLHGNAGDDLFFTTDDGAKDHVFGDGGNDSSIADKDDVLTSIEHQDANA